MSGCGNTPDRRIYLLKACKSPPGYPSLYCCCHDHTAHAAPFTRCDNKYGKSGLLCCRAGSLVGCLMTPTQLKLLPVASSSRHTTPTATHQVAQALDTEVACTAHQPTAQAVKEPRKLCPRVAPGMGCASLTSCSSTSDQNCPPVSTRAHTVAQLVALLPSMI